MGAHTQLPNMERSMDIGEYGQTKMAFEKPEKPSEVQYVANSLLSALNVGVS